MKRLRSRRFCAALVIIAWVASLVSIWGMQEAGRRAVAPLKTCKPADLQGIGLRLEMARGSAEAQKILDGGESGDPRKAACLRSGMAAQVHADDWFIPAYSGLVLALFLFVRACWIAPPWERKAAGWGLLALGVVLALAMAIGDVLENRQLEAMIRADGSSVLTALHNAGAVKWGALAASALLLALLWRSKPSSRLVWVLRLLGVTAAALLIAGLVRSDPQIVNAGMGALAAFWLTALIHAIAVAVEPASVPIPDLLPEGTRQT